MRVATVDGLVTLFYDGSKQLFNQELSSECHNSHRLDEEKDWESWNLSEECKNYFRERLSWQQIIIADGVTEIPDHTFTFCFNIKRVIFANTVIWVGGYAFFSCKSLGYVEWPLNLEYIGPGSFYECNLYSVFIPPMCRGIGSAAFYLNKNLSILHVPQDIELGRSIIQDTKLAKSSPFEVSASGYYKDEVDNDMNAWIKNMNHGETFSLHRACTSFQPLKQVINSIIEEKGLKAFREMNSAGITPSQYLKENPYSKLTEKEIIHDYLMKLMGECE